MTTKQSIEISDAEWEVMRVIWTLGQSTSNEIFENLKEKMGYWVLNISYYLNTEKEKSIISNIKKRLNIKSLDYMLGV